MLLCRFWGGGICGAGFVRVSALCQGRAEADFAAELERNRGGLGASWVRVWSGARIQWCKGVVRTGPGQSQT